MALLLIVPFIQSCQDDITELDDPRDAIAKPWRVTDDSGPFGANGYDVTIRKDPSDKTRVLFENFGGYDSQNDLYATIAGTTLTIPNQPALDDTYTVLGSGTITNGGGNISMTYTVATTDETVTVHANYGPVVTVKKKPVPLAPRPVQ